jgi:dihydroorotate dehydrogenase
MQALLSGANLAETWERIRQTVPVSCLEYRPVFGGVIAVGWQTYLSYLNRLAERNIARQLGGSLESALEEKVAA